MKFYIRKKDSKEYNEITSEDLQKRFAKGENIIFENYIFNDKYYRVD